MAVCKHIGPHICHRPHSNTEMFSCPLHNRPAAFPLILTDGIFVGTDYEPKHFYSGSSLVHNANDSYATLLFSFFPLSTFLL